VKWESHRALTLQTLRAVKVQFPREFLEGLLEGCVEPDREPDRYVSKRVSHHDNPHTDLDDRARRDLVEYYLRLAEYYFARNKLYDAGRALGRALHYVQDGVMPCDRDHEKLEEEVHKVIVTGKGSRKARKIVDAALRESISLLTRFTNDIRKSVNCERVKQLLNTLRTIQQLSLLLLIFTAPAVGYLAGGLEHALAVFAGGLLLYTLVLGITELIRGHLRQKAILCGLEKPKPPPKYRTAM